MAGEAHDQNFARADFDAPPSKRPRLEAAVNDAFDEMDDLYNTPKAQLEPSQINPTPLQALAGEPRIEMINAGSSTADIPGLGMLAIPSVRTSAIFQVPRPTDPIQAPLIQRTGPTLPPEAPQALRVAEIDAVRNLEATLRMDVSTAAPLPAHPANVLPAPNPLVIDLVESMQTPLLPPPLPPPLTLAPSILDEIELALSASVAAPKEPDATFVEVKAEVPPTIPPPPAIFEAEQALRDSAMLDGSEATLKVEGQEAAAPEWEVDSSAQSSSSDDASVSGSDSSGDESVNDYKLLDPEEQARILMQEGGSEDEGGPKGGEGIAGSLRTKNEVVEEKVELPSVIITPDMTLHELGTIEALVNNLVLVKARTSGEYQVLESGSVVCLHDRTVLGVIAEPLGRVQQPRYSIRFNDRDEITASGVGVGTKIYFVSDFATFVFTQALKEIKGSDASNVHDEEIAADEIEFSDDEAEIEHRRMAKAGRVARRAERGGRGRRDGLNNQTDEGPPRAIRRTNRPFIDYDDPSLAQASLGDIDDPYTPLTRPTNFLAMGADQGNLPQRGLNDRDGRNDGDNERETGHARGRGHDRARAGGRGGARGGRGRSTGNRGRGGSARRGDKRPENDHRPRQQHDLPAKPSHYEDPDAPSSCAVSIPASQPHPPMPSYHQRQQPYPSHEPALAPAPAPPSAPQQALLQQTAYGWPPQSSPQLPAPAGNNYPYIPPSEPAAPAYFGSGQQATPSYPSYPPQSQNYPQHSPPMASPPLPPGAFVNPAFFRPPPTHQTFIPPSTAQPYHQPLQRPHRQQPASTYPSGVPADYQSAGHNHLDSGALAYQAGFAVGQAHAPESDAAFRAAQEKIDILRGLNRGPPHGPK